MIEVFPLDIILKLLIAVILGTVIGVERELVNKTAGMRTHALVALGAALFITISEIVIGRTVGMQGASLNPMHVAAYIVSGIGFLGAGVIYKQEDHVSGVTSAAGLWTCAGIGIACGYELYGVAIVATVLVLCIFIFLWKVEQVIRRLRKE